MVNEGHFALITKYKGATNDSLHEALEEPLLIPQMYKIKRCTEMIVFGPKNEIGNICLKAEYQTCFLQVFIHFSTF